jgi:hypothetical protein
MLAKIFSVSLLVGLLIGAVALRAEPELLDFFCMDQTDHEARAFQRARCDELAEARGFSHGVVRPVQDSKCAVGDPNIKPYECVGVGGSAE